MKRRISRKKPPGRTKEARRKAAIRAACARGEHSFSEQEGGRLCVHCMAFFPYGGDDAYSEFDYTPNSED